MDARLAKWVCTSVFSVCKSVFIRLAPNGDCIMGREEGVVARMNTLAREWKTVCHVRERVHARMWVVYNKYCKQVVGTHAHTNTVSHCCVVSHTNTHRVASVGAVAANRRCGVC